MAAKAQDVMQQVPDEQQEELLERVSTIIANLERDADRRVQQRDLVEKRWLDDLAQYHGKYTESLEKQLREARKSTLYINSTRPKTNAMASRLYDMLFPTDDRNWGIQPTPVPELTVNAEQAAQEAAEAEAAAAASKDDQQAQMIAIEKTAVAKAVRSQMDEARKRARAMEEEIDDHLREAKYAASARDCLDDGCKLGTAIMKGPVVGDRNRRSWKNQDIIDENGEVTGNEYGLVDVEDPRPVFWRVNPWGFFPDMDATCIEDAEGNFERHLMNPKQLRKLARQPGFDPDGFRRLLKVGPQSSTPTFMADMRSITGAYNDDTNDQFQVWEYHGPLSQEDMHDIALLMQQNEGGRERATGIMEDLEEFEVDPLMEVEAVVWFCQGEMLKFGLHFLDSGDPIYSVWNLEKDDSSIFGFGIPYIMRDPQKAMAATWRILMDNAGLSSGPQIVINRGVIEPANGVWEMEPRKLWYRKSGAPKNEPPFETYSIDSHMDELLKLIEVAKQNTDEETSMPMIAQGEQGAGVTKTMGGMSLLMNSANVVFRRIVKNWDDDMTTPNIRRMYDFLMQFSSKEHIKGDYEVDARGTSVLLVREMQSQNLLLFLSNFSGHPVLGRYLKKEGLPALRRLVQTMSIPADDVIKTDEEVAADDARAAKEPPMPDPAILKIEAEMNDKERQREHDYTMAMVARETAMVKLAAEQNITIEQVMATLQNHREDRASKERIFAAEAAVEERQRKSGDDSGGSGGYIS